MYLSESVTSLYKYSWLSLDFFALDKIPVKVEGVYEKCSKGDRLIGYRYFLINDEEYEVNSLYYFRESAIERKLDFNHDNNAPILVYDNSLPYFKELLRSNINKSLRENICLVSETEINVFADENAEELNRLYEHYSNTYNKCASVSGGYLKPLCSPKKHNECIIKPNDVVVKTEKAKQKIKSLKKDD